MPISIVCPSCAATLNAPDHQAGKSGKCPKCQTRVELPPATPTRTLTLTPADGEIESAVERLSSNWTRAVSRPRTGGTSYILQSLAHGRSHAVILESKRSPRRLGGSP